MSKQRQRARAAQKQRPPKKREHREPTVVTTTSAKTRVARQRSAEAKKPGVYRQRRYPPLPMWLKLSLAVFWIAVQVAALLLLDDWGRRIAVLIVSTFALPLIVVLVRDPARRTKR